MAPRILPNANLRPDDLASLRLLVVDDNANVRRLIGDVLRAGGVGRVDTAEDGLRAREKLQSWNPDIVFSDWSMPLMGGLELTRSIRRAAVHPDRKVPNPQVPVIIVSAHRGEREVEEARRAGVNEFVIKPFTPAALLSRIQLVLTRPRPFIVSSAYVGPDRRRRVELSYSGPLRRTCDPNEVIDVVERQTTRETISVELETLRRLIRERGGVDRETLQMTFRVMQHTTFRARQVRDATIDRAAQLLMTYAEAMGAPERCDPAVLDLHFAAFHTLLETPEGEIATATKVVDKLETTVQREIKAAKAA
ncbi:MAG: response regulator [Phenylobacterium sp.]